MLPIYKIKLDVKSIKSVEKVKVVTPMI